MFCSIPLDFNNVTENHGVGGSIPPLGTMQTAGKPPETESVIVIVRCSLRSLQPLCNRNQIFFHRRCDA
jgi:hypothetical protein